MLVSYRRISECLLKVGLQFTCCRSSALIVSWPSYTRPSTSSATAPFTNNKLMSTILMSTYFTTTLQMSITSHGSMQRPAPGEQRTQCFDHFQLRTLNGSTGYRYQRHSMKCHTIVGAIKTCCYANNYRGLCYFWSLLCCLECGDHSSRFVCHTL